MDLQNLLWDAALHKVSASLVSDTVISDAQGRFSHLRVGCCCSVCPCLSRCSEQRGQVWFHWCCHEAMRSRFKEWTFPLKAITSSIRNVSPAKHFHSATFHFLGRDGPYSLARAPTDGSRSSGGSVRPVPTRVVVTTVRSAPFRALLEGICQWDNINRLQILREAWKMTWKGIKNFPWPRRRHALRPHSSSSPSLPSSPAPILDAKSRSGGCSPAPTFRPRVCPSPSPLRGLPAPGLAAAEGCSNPNTCVQTRILLT